MLKAIDEGTVQVVIAWALDRLQRNRRDEVRLYELCQKRGARLALVNGAELDFQTAAGRFVADSLGSVARMEVEMKSDRQKRASEQAAKAGKRVGGRRPFGYDADGMTIRPMEAEAIRTGFDDLLAGVSLAEIARRWNAAGHTTGQTRTKAPFTGQPSPWHAYSVRMVLLNPRYAGQRALNGEIVSKALWPPVVDENTWRAAVALLRHPDRSTGPANARRLLTGIARCGVCDATVHAGGNARVGVPGYRCSGSSGHFSRKSEPVDDYVSQSIISYLSLPGAEGELTGSQLRVATARLREKLATAEGAMADAGRVNVLGPLVQADDVRAVWDALPLSKQRAVVDLLVDVVIYPPGRGVRRFDPQTVAIVPKN
jgi:hypothetical protein